MYAGLIIFILEVGNLEINNLGYWFRRFMIMLYIKTSKHYLYSSTSTNITNFPKHARLCLKIVSVVLATIYLSRMDKYLHAFSFD
jgi:hypothetical protein